MDDNLIIYDQRKTYPIPREAKEKGLNVIKNTLHNNNYDISKIKKHPAQQKHKHRPTTLENKMGSVRIQQKRNKKNYKIIQGYANKHSI
jgi:hypothetical protein